MIKTVLYEMKVRALEDPLGDDTPGRVAEGVDLQAMSALPGVAASAVEWVQQSKRELHARDRHARTMKPLAATAHDVLEIGILQRLGHQPVCSAFDQRRRRGT